MFGGQRYMTRGVEKRLPLELQMLLWNMIDELKIQYKDLDYLQVFELYIEDFNEDVRIQGIIHKQEIPQYEKEYKVTVDNPVNLKVFVIDDKTHCTMLLAEEY